jgi:hypothetical protein
MVAPHYIREKTGTLLYFQALQGNHQTVSFRSAEASAVLRIYYFRLDLGFDIGHGACYQKS